MTTERAEEQRGAEPPKGKPTYREAMPSEAAGVKAPAEQKQPALKPGGIGTGVAFDWALTVQLLIDAAFFLPGTGPGSRMAGQPIAARLAVALATVVAAAIVFTQGEALRRGRRAARIIQIVANSLLVILGLVQIPGLIPSLQAGQVSTLVVEVILLVVNPLIVWLLTRRRTRDWFASTTSAEARARHGGRWLLWMAVYAIIGGAAVAFAGYY